MASELPACSEQGRKSPTPARGHEGQRRAGDPEQTQGGDSGSSGSPLLSTFDLKSVLYEF